MFSRLLRARCSIRTVSKRFYSLRGVAVGVYEDDEVIFTANGERLNSETEGKLLKNFNLTGKTLKKGKSRLFLGLDDKYPLVSVTCLGAQNAGYNELEELDEKRENIRVAIGTATKELRDVGATEIVVDDCGDAEAAAEAGHLALFCYDELKKESSRKTPVALLPYKEAGGWASGVKKAEGQNIARQLMEMPANLLTPTRFAELAHEILDPFGVRVTARNYEWIVLQKMGAFLSVAKGSSQTPVFLELEYRGRETDVKPFVLVGKGITFDSGGISIKSATGMDKMRGDMGGAACTLGSIRTVAALKVPINVIGLIPLCENMPSGTANKPGDVITALNGKTIQVDNTDAEGRLILADALCYSAKFKPDVVMDMATLTGAMMVALGTGATGVFTNSLKMWMYLQQAGMRTGDRVWRMPVFDLYTKHIEGYNADLSNISKHSGYAGSCTAAAFLKEFVTSPHWLHLDIAGVMEHKDDVPYLCKGLTGRPTRTVVEFVQRLSQYGP